MIQAKSSMNFLGIMLFVLIKLFPVTCFKLVHSVIGNDMYANIGVFFFGPRLIVFNLLCRYWKFIHWTLKIENYIEISMSFKWSNLRNIISRLWISACILGNLYTWPVVGDKLVTLWHG